jgi:transmembrane sensor
MPGIDKQKIDNYFKGGYSSDEENDLANAFTEESNIEGLRSVLSEQWDNMPGGPDSHRLYHIIHKINYQINSTELKSAKRPVAGLITWYARIAAILLLPLVVYAGIMTYQNRKTADVEGYAEISAPMGARIKFTLPDGSFGWLNSGSTMKYATNFSKIREVMLTGQAFFDVMHKDNAVFVVKTKYIDVEVKGTAFDIAAYEDEGETSVTLERGSVLLKSDKFRAPVEMKPNDQVVYNTNNLTIKKEVVTAPIFSAWKEGKLMLRNASIQELAKQLSRWYNVDVAIQNGQNADFLFRATFEDENLGEVLRLLKITSQLDYKIDERVKQADGSFTKQKVALKFK